MKQRERAFIALFLFFLAIVSATDIAVDYQEGVSIQHLVIEIFLLALCLTGIAYLTVQWRRTKANLTAMGRNLSKTNRDLLRWKKEAERFLAGLGQTIDNQFQRWSLTEAEKEVGLLILKGLSFKEIAALRGSSERTVRQQAQAVYAKAGLAGRSEFSAFFLEDLLLPSQSMDRQD